MTKTPVIARDEAISVVLCHRELISCYRERSVAISVDRDGQGVKIEIASQARNDSNIVSSRGTWRSRFSAARKPKREIAALRSQ